MRSSMAWRGAWLIALATVLGSGLYLQTVGQASPQSSEKQTVPPRERQRPNILVWMVDDLGFAQVGSYGGVIDTPNIDRVAKRGLKYTNYHATPICSASRAAFLTGRNPHRVNVGGHAALAVPRPGYNGRIPDSAGTIADNLRHAGYRTYAVGKWDHLPTEDTSAAGPFTYWPSGQGFDRFYGFLAPETDQARPRLWTDHTPVKHLDVSARHLTAELADKAIEMIRSRSSRADRAPFFVYWATGALHAPHQAPSEYLARYRGRFDAGWDVVRADILKRQIALGIVPKGTTLSARPAEMPAWDSLNADQKKSYARAMEAAAAFMTYADAEFGRILDALEADGELDNTIILITSDNGASAEGGPNGIYNESLIGSGEHASLADNLKFYDKWGTGDTFAHYPFGWAVAGNTPFRYYKKTTYEGGTRVPLIIAWPQGGIPQGEIRTQFSYITDLTPTLLDAAGVDPASEIDGVRQMNFDGISLVPTFHTRNEVASDRTQYVEMFGNTAVWQGRWKAVNPHVLDAWNLLREAPFRDEWQLYDLERDPTESRDLSREQPERLAQLKAAFEKQAIENNVLPLMNTSVGLSHKLESWKKEYRARGGVWSYTGPLSGVPSGLAPPILDRSYIATVQFTVPDDRASGTLFAVGGNFGGVSLYLDEGRPTFAYRGGDSTLTRVAADRPLSAGLHELRVRFTVEKPDLAAVALMNGNAIIASGRIEQKLLRAAAINEDFTIGDDLAGQVADYGDRRSALKIDRTSFDFNTVATR